MKNHQLKLIKYDLIRGFKYNRIKFIVLGIYVFACCSIFLVEIKNTSILTGELTVGYLDYLINLFKGSLPFDLAMGIKLPIPFIGIHIFIASIVGYYPFDDINGYGKQIFIRVNKKIKWWNSKVIWCFCSVILSYCIIFLSTLVFCICFRQNIITNFHPKLFEQLEQLIFNDTPNITIFSYMFVLPILYSCFASLLQISLSMAIGPILSFLSSMFLLFFGIVVTNPCVLINYSMLLRNYRFSGVQIYGSTGVLILIISILCTYLVGIILIKNKQLY